ncbi:MAG: DUF3791 domain-containing protein [Prevotellaceae bacterium]|nr:DUF3791 domain-containing protein [Prevotellaceae bacterium]
MIGEFARTHHLTTQQAYLYLKWHRGIEFLNKSYDVEHLRHRARRQTTPPVMTNDEQFLIENITTELIVLVMQDFCISFVGSTPDDRNIFPPLLLKNPKNLDSYSILLTFAALFPMRSATYSRKMKKLPEQVQEVVEASSRTLKIE